MKLSSSTDEFDLNAARFFSRLVRRADRRGQPQAGRLAEGLRLLWGVR